MSRASQARRIAAAAAYGGTGLGALAGAGFGVLAVEAKLARRWIGQPFGQALTADGLYGSGSGAPIALVLLGDSSAAGLGVERPEQTPGAIIATGLAAVSKRPVRLSTFAVVGAESAGLRGQVDELLAEQPAPDVAVIMVGANDVTHRVRPATAVRWLADAVTRLDEAGARVVVGTCPDLGTIEPVAQPLRTIARRWSRQLAAAQTVAVVEAGGRSVSLADLLGPEFAATPGELFSADRFHPSAAGYARLAAALLPSVCAALDLWPDGGAERSPEPRRGEGVAPVATAASHAADVPGAEVVATKVAGTDRGPRGRWAVLLRRRRQPVGGELPSSDGAPEPTRESVAEPVHVPEDTGPADRSTGAAGERVADYPREAAG